LIRQITRPPKGFNRAVEMPFAAILTSTTFGLERDERVDEEVEPLEWLDHGLAQDREATFGKALELPAQDLEAEFVLGAEVVIEVALATEVGAFDDVIDGGSLEPSFGDERGGGVDDAIAGGWGHAVIIGPFGPIIKGPVAGAGCCLPGRRQVKYMWIIHLM
jgi:hypothetical protein